jgi:hypothetical protein
MEGGTWMELKDPRGLQISTWIVALRPSAKLLLQKDDVLLYHYLSFHSEANNQTGCC